VSFIDEIRARNYSTHHEWKIICYAKKLSKYTHFFNYKEIYKIKDVLRGSDGYYKAIRSLCAYFEEMFLDNDDVLKDLSRISKLVKKPTSKPDIYCPTDEEIQETLEKLKYLNKNIYHFYIGLIHSGVRIREFAYYLEDPSRFKVIEKKGFKKVLLNYKRGNKYCQYIYLPLEYSEGKYVSPKYLSKFLSKHKDLLRPKYIRNWFYSKCLSSGIPSPVADFYQGRSAVTVGDRHYLDKEKMADEMYLKICVIDFIK